MRVRGVPSAYVEVGLPAVDVGHGAGGGELRQAAAAGAATREPGLQEARTACRATMVRLLRDGNSRRAWYTVRIHMKSAVELLHAVQKGASS